MHVQVHGRRCATCLLHACVFKKPPPPSFSIFLHTSPRPTSSSFMGVMEILLSITTPSMYSALCTHPPRVYLSIITSGIITVTISTMSRSAFVTILCPMRYSSVHQASWGETKEAQRDVSFKCNKASFFLGQAA